MNEYKNKFFKVGTALENDISGKTGDGATIYQKRDFVTPLLDFCRSNNYNGRLGVVYGLRSTGKTVGMLQAAQTLLQEGRKIAYARFNYKEAGMRAVTEEIRELAESGYTHFFVDEASYLNDFINLSPTWSDDLVPEKKIKIIVSGTDSFMLWTAKLTSLFHRYVEFSTNWNSYAEFKRIGLGNFEKYKISGGVLTHEIMEDYVRSAVVDNLIHTIDNCVDESNCSNAYTDRLYGIDKEVIFKAIVSIMKYAVEQSLVSHFYCFRSRLSFPPIF